MAVTKRIKSLSPLLLLTVCMSAEALILPEDRVDAMYHSYDGGDITVNGPSILVRKSVGDSVSVSANHYVDSISSASIDVVTLLGASRYSEERTQQSVGVDYLHDKSIISYSFTTSVENDFEATTNNFNISQEMFGGLTTVALGFKLGSNIVLKSDDPVYRKEADSRGYRVTASQVLTKNMLLGLAYEIITDEGFLNNPYRSIVRVEGVTTYNPEIYPNTRTSNALGFNLRYFLPNRSAIYGGYRYFIDSWDIEADTFDVGYVFPFEEKWLFELTYRYYSQNNAEFYSDLFDAYYTYMARDKELSTYNSHSIGLGATYKLGGMGLFEKGTVNFSYNYFLFDYQDFRDIPQGEDLGLLPGQEPLYELKANVIRFYLSFWF